MSSPIERVGTRDPNCCQKNTASGRCVYKAVTGSQYCPLHGGSSSERKTERTELRNYTLQHNFASQIADKANSGQLKTLNEEVGIVRFTLETLLNQCTSNNDFMIFSDKIDKLVARIQSLVEAIQKLQERNNELFDRETVNKIFDSIIQLLATEILPLPNGEEITLRISDEIFKQVANIGGESTSGVAAT